MSECPPTDPCAPARPWVRWLRATWRAGLGTYVGLYLAGLAVLSYATLTAPERHWWSALNLYLPQYIWLAPGAVALGAAWSLQRRLVVLPALALAWTAGPLMGWCWKRPRTLPHSPRFPPVNSTWRH